VFDKGFDEQKLRKAIAAYFGLVSFVDHNVGRLLGVLERTDLGDETRVIYTSDHGDNLGTRGLWGKSTMYEESAGVPMMMAGPEVPQGIVCREPVSLIDCFPTILQCVGAQRAAADADLPGASLFDIVRGTAPRRTVMSEYHASGSATGAFMVRKGQFKFVYYVGMPPQLFDLDADPQEKRDLARDEGYGGVVKDCEAALRQVVDPEAADRQAFADQAQRLAAAGGAEAVLARGGFGFSPVPGTKAIYEGGETRERN
jgi:choline-sulfatase